MKDYYGIDAGLVVSIESSEKVKSILLFYFLQLPLFLSISQFYILFQMDSQIILS
jgi:hypothetical protein